MGRKFSRICLAATSAALCVALVTGAASAAPTIVASFDPKLGELVAAAWDPASGNVFVYKSFDTRIREYTPSGQLVNTIPSPGPASNDFDMDFAESSLLMGRTQIPAGSLLVMNAEASPVVQFALNKSDGKVLAQMPIPAGSANEVVGMTHYAARGSVFIVEWADDEVIEINQSTGAEKGRFPLAPPGSPAMPDGRPFGVYFGDLDVHPTSGNLFVAGSDFNAVRELTPTGSYVRDVDLRNVGLNGGISGIAFDSAADLWITTTTGWVYKIGGLLTAPDPTPTPTPTPTATVTPPKECQQADAFCTGDEDDVVEGTSAANFISTAGGNDTIYSAAGDDTVDAGRGNDVVAAGDGGDYVNGGAGRDEIRGDSETVSGRSHAGEGEDGDVLEGGGGDDLVLGEAGNDEVGGGGGDDILKAGDGFNILRGGPGRDKCYGDKDDKFRACEVIRLRRHFD